MQTWGILVCRSRGVWGADLGVLGCRPEGFWGANPGEFEVQIWEFWGVDLGGLWCKSGGFWGADLGVLKCRSGSFEVQIQGSLGCGSEGFGVQFQGSFGVQIQGRCPSPCSPQEPGEQPGAARAGPGLFWRRRRRERRWVPEFVNVGQSSPTPTATALFSQSRPDPTACPGAAQDEAGCDRCGIHSAPPHPAPAPFYRSFFTEKKKKSLFSAHSFQCAERAVTS